MNEPTMETLARRLDHMERENWRLKQAGVVALAVIAAIGLMGQVLPSKVEPLVEADMITAKRIVLQDKSGKIRIELGVDVDRNSANLKFFDKNESIRAGLGVGPEGQSILVFNDKDGMRASLGVVREDVLLALVGNNRNSTATLTVEADSSPTLILQDKRKKTSASAKLRVRPDGTSVLGFLRNGKPLIALGVVEEKGGIATLSLFDQKTRRSLVAVPSSLELYDTAGKRRATLQDQIDGSPILALFDKNEKKRVGLGLKPGSPYLSLYDDDQRPRLGLAVVPSGSAGFVLTDEDGKVIWSAP